MSMFENLAGMRTPLRIDWKSISSTIGSGILFVSVLSNTNADGGITPSNNPQDPAIHGIVLAQTTEETAAAQPDETTGSSEEKDEPFIARWHDYLSDKVESIGESADRMFDPGIAFDEINQTSIRLRLDSDFIEGESTEFDGKADVKLVLPAADGRLRLLLSTDDVPNEGGGQVGEPIFDENDDRGSAALDFSVRDDEKWRLSLSAGARSDQLYSRFRLRRNFELPARWKSRVLNRLTYFADDGWQNDFRIDFDRTLGRPLPDTTEFRKLAVGGDRRQWLFRSSSRYIVNEDKESDLYEQRFSLFNRLSKYSAIAYEALAYGCTNANVIDETIDCREYNLRVRYKWVVPKYNWLAFEVWPVAAFPESEDFDFVAKMRFRVEMWFGHGERAQGGRGVRF